MKKLIIITDLHMWSMEANKGGRAFITTVEAYLKEGWDLTIISTGGGIPEHVRVNATIYEASFPKVDKLYTSKNKLLRGAAKILKSRLINRFYYKTGSDVLSSASKGEVVLYAYEVAGVKASKALSKKYHVPFVTRFQGTIIANEKDTFINRFRFYPHFSALSTPSDLVIMTNDGTQGLKALKALGNNSKVEFLMNGVSIPQLPTSQERKEIRSELGFDDKFVFLTVSRLVPWKKVERAILAFAKIHKQIPHSFLHIIGDGVSRSFLEEYAQKSGAAQNIVFHGAIEQLKVFKYMAASDVFLSLYDLSNVGNPLLEAMSCGKPIITLDNGDTSMFIKNMENGILLPMTEVDNISDYMYRLYSDQSLAKSLGMTARKHAEEHFWSWEERMKHEILEVESLLNTKKEL